jgi:hypothetical protein
MSFKTMQIPTEVKVCDWCKESLDKYDIHDGKYHKPLTASIVNGYISHPTSDKRVNKFYFFWQRREERKPDVRYDFHTRCFDIMVKKAMALKHD